MKQMPVVKGKALYRPILKPILLCLVVLPATEFDFTNEFIFSIRSLIVKWLSFIVCFPANKKRLAGSGSRFQQARGIEPNQTGKICIHAGQAIGSVTWRRLYTKFIDAAPHIK